MNPLNAIMVLANYALTRLAKNQRVISFQGEDMAHTQTHNRATPILDLEDIDEALRHTTATQPRDDQWWRWTDALLDQRNRLAQHTKQTNQP